MKIKQDAPVSIYQQLVEQLRARIETGEWKPGMKLPSETELARELDISRGTIRQAMTVLVNEGVVERIQGKGSFVKAPRRNLTRSALIGVVIPYDQEIAVQELLLGIESSVKQRRYHILVVQTGKDVSVRENDMLDMRQKGVEGLIIFPASDVEADASISQLQSEFFPFVLVEHTIPGLQTPHVVVDNFDGGYQATTHLIESGHKRIGFITPTHISTSSVRERYLGYRHALKEHEIPYSDELFLTYEGLSQPDPNLAALRKVLTVSNRPTAFFAASDQMAIRMLDAAQSQGIRVPQDLALVGFGDIKEASQLSIPLTTVEHPVREVGRRAGDILMAQINNLQYHTNQVVLPVKFIIRRSSGYQPMKWGNNS